jgi:hypothetical protein
MIVFQCVPCEKWQAVPEDTSAPHVPPPLPKASRLSWKRGTSSAGR